MYNIRLLAAELYGDHHITQIENWPRIAVVGAGAVGGYVGGLLVRAAARAIMLGRPIFVDAVNKNGLFLTLCNFRKTSACRYPRNYPRLPALKLSRCLNVSAPT